MNTTLYATLRDEQLSQRSKTLKRETSLPHIPGKINVISGVRRCGKTTLMQQIMQDWQDQGVPWERILYLNFEDDRLLGFDHTTLGTWIDYFYHESPSNHDQTCCLFFDEIQNVEEWPKLMRRLLDTKPTRIVLSGSSAKLLSKEIHTSLRGRAFTTELWPYSLHEYLQVLGEPPVMGPSQRERDQRYQQFRQFLFRGGFPDVITLPEAQRRQILSDYLQVAMMRDIIERHHITRLAVLKTLTQQLIHQISTPFSINKCHQGLQSRGLNVAKNTVYEYINHLQDAYLVFLVPRFSESYLNTQRTPQKAYIIDTGIAHAQSTSRLDNLGRLFENMVFLELKRRNHQIYYFHTQQGHEVDFMTCDPEGQWALFQVAWDISAPETLHRERRALEEAQTELNLPGYLITPDTFWKTFPPAPSPHHPYL